MHDVSSCENMFYSPSRKRLAENKNVGSATKTARTLADVTNKPIGSRQFMSIKEEIVARDNLETQLSNAIADNYTISMDTLKVKLERDAAGETHAQCQQALSSRMMVFDDLSAKRTLLLEEIEDLKRRQLHLLEGKQLALQQSTDLDASTARNQKRMEEMKVVANDLNSLKKQLSDAIDDANAEKVEKLADERRRFYLARSLEIKLEEESIRLRNSMTIHKQRDCYKINRLAVLKAALMEPVPVRFGDHAFGLVWSAKDTNGAWEIHWSQPFKNQNDIAPKKNTKTFRRMPSCGFIVNPHRAFRTPLGLIFQGNHEQQTPSMHLLSQDIMDIIEPSLTLA